MGLCRWIGGVLTGAIIAQGSVSALAEDARFKVRTQVINPALPAFTTTVNEMGNGRALLDVGGGFEPSVFRTRMTALADAPDSILSDPTQISNWNSWPEGMLDGADVEVLRIIDGAFQTVRVDQVAEGGFHASGWGSILGAGQIIAAGTTRWNLSWDAFNRLDTPWFYTVRAVDSAGNLSPAATSISVMPPDKPGRVTEEAAVAQMQLSGREGGVLPSPQNLQAKLTISRTLMLSWDPVPGARGYVIFASSVPPEQHRGFSIKLAGKGAPIRAGDMIFLRKKFLTPTRAEVATGRIWNAQSVAATFGIPLLPGLAGDPGMPPVRLVPHKADTSVTDPGETYLQVDLEKGTSIALGKFNFAGPAQQFYSTLDPARTYRFEIWLRARGKVLARFALNGVYGAVPGLPANLPVTPQWRRYVVDFRVPPAPADNRSVGRMALLLSGEGQVDADNFRLYEAGTDFMDLLPEDRAALADGKMSALRMHMFSRTRQATYDLSQLLSPAGVAPRTGGQGLPRMLEISQSLGMEPWLQIEPHLTREEWLGLVEYLAAPFDPAKDDPKALPWAARRVAQGHPAPWTADFPKIWFEIGNETWNRLFAPWNFGPMPDGGHAGQANYTPGQVYGLYQEHVLAIMRESPWWDRLAPKLEPVIGGWNVGSYGIEALKSSPHSRVLTNAPYIGGWDAGEGAVQQTPEGYASVMAFAPQVMIASAKKFHDAVQDISDRKVILGTYESGPGYEMSGLNGARVSPERALEQERVMKSAAAGAATLDNFLARAVAGDRLQNFFAFGRGDRWRSHARVEDGGQAYPSWDWLALFNRLGGGGDLLRVDEKAVPARDLPVMGPRKEMKGAPMAAAYALRKGDDLVVIVVSRAVPDVPQGASGRMSVRVDLPITAARRLVRYRESGDYRAENFTRPETRIQSDQLDIPADPGRLDIPNMAPASVEVYVFEGATFAD